MDDENMFITVYLLLEIYVLLFIMIRLLCYPILSYKTTNEPIHLPMLVVIMRDNDMLVNSKAISERVM